MTLHTGKTAFSLEQQVAVREQATAEDEPVEESYRQRGLFLVDAEVAEGQFRRTIEGYLLTDEAIASVQGRQEVEFSQLEQFHEEAAGAHKVKLHVDDALEIESDLENTNVAAAADPLPPPYDLGEVPIPLPVFVLYWPSITGTPRVDAEPGDRWARNITVQIGSGTFPLSYSVQLVEHVDGDPLLRIALDEQEPVAKVGPLEDIALHLEPRGTWDVRVSGEDGMWQEAKGEMTFRVRAKYKEDEDDTEEIEVDVLRWRNKFSVKRIPVTFDDERIYPAEWRPEATPAPTTAGDAARGSPGEAAGSKTPPSSPAGPESHEQESSGGAEGSR